MRLSATYHVRGDAASIEARALAIAVEQSVEMPLAAIDDPQILEEIVGTVEAITDLGDGIFAVRIGLATATIAEDAGQLLNMLFGNTSLHQDVTLADVDLPTHAAKHGSANLRARLQIRTRAFTGSALKPQGMRPEQLAELAERFARGGLDFIKDDHGLADQDYSRFSHRVPACAAAVARAVRSTGHPTRYIPSLTGNLDHLRAQATLAREQGLDTIMLAPMIAGFPAFQAIRAEFPDMAIFAHPSLGGLRIAPELLIGKLFPLIGADAVIFPSYGGRFGYSQATCLTLATNARLAGSLPVPAGGMTIERTSEILDFYGPDTMLLMGGSLLLAKDDITRGATALTEAVANHSYV